MSRHIQLPCSQQRLEQTLAQWRQWRCDPDLPGSPHLERRLEGGLSNHNFLVRAAEQLFVVRIDGINPSQHGLSRQVEYRALESAAGIGIAPQPCYFNPELGALVCQHLTPDTRQAPMPIELARLCQHIHGLPHRHHRLDLDDRIRRYTALIKRAKKTLPSTALASAVERILPHCETSDPVLCHNDLLPANLLRSGDRLFALDWEYCAMGNPWFDLAVASDGQDYSPEGIEEFLTAYLKRPPDEQDWQQLQWHRIIYRYLELLWHLVQAEEESSQQILVERQTLLGDMLSQALPG
mgnify:FL=1